MGKRLYVGNIPYTTTETELTQFFSDAGTVASVSIITDRQTGRSKGFAFVEMSSDEEAQKAVQTLNGHPFGNRDIVINEARPITERKFDSRRTDARYPRSNDSGPRRRKFDNG